MQQVGSESGEPDDNDADDDNGGDDHVRSVTWKRRQERGETE